MSDVSLIHRKLSQVRRRIFFVHLIKSLSIAICVLAFLFALLRFQGVAGRWFSGATAAWPCGVVLTAAAAVAFLRTPGLKATAKLVDRKLALQQRLETALECIGPREEVDRLVLKDAAQRVSHVIPAAIVPVRLAQFARVAVGAGLITLAGLALIRFLEGWNRGSFVTQRNRSQVAGRAPMQAGELPVVQPGNEEARVSSSAAGPGFSVAVPDAGPARRLTESNQNQALNPAATSARSAAQSPVASGASKEGAANQTQGMQRAQSGNAPIPMSAPPEDANRQGAPGRSLPSRAQAPPSGKPGDTAGLSRSSSGAASIRAAAKAGVGSATGASDAAAAGRGDRDAAASKGTPQPSSPSAMSKPDAALMARYAREYASYRLAVEAALRKERIPPGFRKYIANYFASIHP